MSISKNAFLLMTVLGCSGCTTHKAFIPLDVSEKNSLTLYRGSGDCVEDSRDLTETILTLAITKLTGYVVDQIDKRLQDEVALYTAVYGSSFEASSQNTSFYEVGADSLQMKVNCMKFTRRTGGEVAMEVIAGLKIEDETLILSPRTLVYNKTAAKSANVVGSVIKVKFSTTWREENRGMHEDESGAITLLAEKVDLSKGPKAFDYRNQNIARSVPLPPWSRFDKIAYGKNRVLVTFTVAEAGNQPWLLENGAKLFHDNKEKLATQLSEAALKLTNP